MSPAVIEKNRTDQHINTEIPKTTSNRKRGHPNEKQTKQSKTNKKTKIQRNELQKPSPRIFFF